MNPGTRGPYRARPPHPRKAEVLDLLRHGVSYGAIMDVTGIPKATIGLWAKAAGIVRQAQAGHGPRYGTPGTIRVLTFAGRPVSEGMVIDTGAGVAWFVLSVREVKGWHRARVLCGAAVPPDTTPETLAWYRDGLAELAP